MRFQSTPPVKAATSLIFLTTQPNSISIHAAREGGDFDSASSSRRKRNFNPRRP